MTDSNPYRIMDATAQRDIDVAFDHRISEHPA